MIHNLRQQRTIRRPVIVTGFGYWSGRDVTVEFRPAAADTGIVFVRGDLESPRRVPAVVRHRVEVPRRTTLAHDGAQVEMVEHILAALAGLCIDNCELWIDNAEMPGCDGSSLAFVEALEQAGAVEQNAVRPLLVTGETIRVGNEDGWVEIRPSTAPNLSVKYRIDYHDFIAIGRQTFEMTVTPDTFRSELAAARTFLLKQEAQWLRERGLGTRVTADHLLVFDTHGPIDNALRFDDECVRHKVLDLIGDLALCGCDLHGHVTAYRGGHRLHAELVRALLAEGERIEGLRKSA